MSGSGFHSSEMKDIEGSANFESLNVGECFDRIPPDNKRSESMPTKLKETVMADEESGDENMFSSGQEIRDCLSPDTSIEQPELTGCPSNVVIKSIDKDTTVDSSTTEESRFVDTNRNVGVVVSPSDDGNECAEPLSEAFNIGQCINTGYGNMHKENKFGNLEGSWIGIGGPKKMVEEAQSSSRSNGKIEGNNETDSSADENMPSLESTDADNCGNKIMKNTTEDGKNAEGIFEDEADSMQEEREEYFETVHNYGDTGGKSEVSVTTTEAFIPQDENTALLNNQDKRVELEPIGSAISEDPNEKVDSPDYASEEESESRVEMQSEINFINDKAKKDEGKVEDLVMEVIGEETNDGDIEMGDDVPEFDKKEQDVVNNDEDFEEGEADEGANVPKTSRNETKMLQSPVKIKEAFVELTEDGFSKSAVVEYKGKSPDNRREGSSTKQSKEVLPGSSQEITVKDAIPKQMKKILQKYAEQDQDTDTDEECIVDEIGQDIESGIGNDEMCEEEEADDPAIVESTKLSLSASDDSEAVDSLSENLLNEMYAEDEKPESKSVVKRVTNVERIKRKLEEILESSKVEEDAAVEELKRMKNEKTDMLNQITSEIEKLKAMMGKGKQTAQVK